MADENTILRIPDEESVTCHMLDAKGRTTNDLQTGHRPNEASIGILDEENAIFDLGNIKLHRIIKYPRDVTNRWCQDGWFGMTTRTRELLNFWCQIDPSIVMHPFWCQMETIETIWLFEASKVHDPDPHKKAICKPTVDNSIHSDGVPRMAFKMTTGSGKTNVMVMIMLWMRVNNMHQDDAGIVNFLVIAPSLTAKRQLEVLGPKRKTELWHTITFREFYRMHNRAQVTVINFYVLQRRAVTVNCKSLRTKKKKILNNDIVKR